MGRELKRVPLDFDWPVGVIWAGYTMSLCTEMETYYKKKMCERCHQYQRLMGLTSRKDSEMGCPEDHLGPPKGKGYQLWETTSEGSPVSPVFTTIDKLAAWCEKNATTFGPCKATKAEWKKMLSKNDVGHKEGNVTFV
jgi:hypothetical protein